MFSKLDTKSRRRRILSPTTVAASVGAHVLLLGGALLASSGEPIRPQVHEFDIDYYPQEVPPQPVPPAPAPPEPIAPPRESAPPTPGDFVNPSPPDEIPAELPKYSPSDRPLTPDMVTGEGKPGDVIGLRKPGDDRPLTGSTAPVPDAGAVYQPTAVEERPALRNTAEMQRVLQRLYPELLRETGIAGQTQLQFVVDAEGRVEPGSVTVVSATHPAFSEPSLRAAEKFRFRPAKIGGRPVRVVINMPITWKLDGN